MAAPVLRVDGARELRAALKRAGVDVQDLKDAHRQVAEMVAAKAAPDAPRSPHGSNRGPSGTLAASVRAAGTQSAAIVRAGSARVPYAAPIHFGWAARGIEAQPWLAEAAERTRDTWENTYLQAIEAIVNTIEGSTP